MKGTNENTIVNKDSRCCLENNNYRSSTL